MKKKAKMKNSHRLLEKISAKQMVAKDEKKLGASQAGASLKPKGKWGIPQ